MTTIFRPTLTVFMSRVFAIGTTAMLVLAACAPAAPPPEPTAAPVAVAATVAPPAAYKACVAFDTGGLGDKGFNDLAMKGLDDAKAAGYDTAYAEAQGATDYAGNIQRLIDEGCQTVITVGFTQGEATAGCDACKPGNQLCPGGCHVARSRSGLHSWHGRRPAVPAKLHRTGLPD